MSRPAMLRSYLAIAVLLLSAPAVSSELDAREIYLLWAEKVEACRGHSDPLKVAAYCAERDVYLDILYRLDACEVEDPDQGCTLRE